MSILKKATSFLTLSTIFFTGSVHSNCDEYCECTTGCSYEASRNASCVVPAIVIGAAALGAMIGLALTTSCSNQHSHHCHKHHHK